MKPNYPFPWHYYIRTIRSRIALVLFTSILTYTVCQHYQEGVFYRVAFIVGITTLYACIQGYFRVAPIRNVLSRIDKLQFQLPHNKKLNTIYQKNEWVLIQEMLKLTEKYIKDQSAHIMAEQLQSHTLVESIPEGIVIVDEFFNILHRNGIFHKKFIKTRGAAAHENNKLWKIFQSPELMEAFESVKKTKEIKKLKGLQLGLDYYNISITPLQSSKDLKMIGIFHNITESILTEKMRVDFVANISHEIRTPLTSIKGFSQLLLAQKEICPIELHSPLERILYNSERLNDLFNGLLNLSVLESKYEINKEEFSLSSLIKSIQSNIKAKYQHKNIMITFSGDNLVFADRKLLEQAFTNLIDNAVKYSKKDDVLIELHHLFDSKNQVTISKIQDNGPGINSQDLARIFERFYRTQEHGTSSIEGSGLGLSIVKHIINKHIGLIHADSSQDEGTCFTITLPTK